MPWLQLLGTLSLVTAVFSPKSFGFKPCLQQILHQTLILTCHLSLFDTRTDWTDERGPPAKHCLCSVLSFHVRKLRNRRRVGGCLFHVPMADLFHKGWSVNSQLVLTAANEKHEPFLNICQVPLSVLCPYSWMWQEHVPVLTVCLFCFFFFFTKILNNFLLQTICERPEDGHLIALFSIQFYSCCVFKWKSNILLHFNFHFFPSLLQQ